MRIVEGIEQVILDRLKSQEDCSFAELDEAIHSLYSYGEYKLEHPHFENIFFWVNMSENYVEAIKTLLSQDKIKITPCHIAVYLMDGKVPALPQATKAKSYKKPHWLPCVVERGVNFETPTKGNNN